MRRLASPQEDALVQALGNKFDAALVAMGKAVVRQITIESINGQGLDPKYLQYVFWVLGEDAENWPSMGPLDRKMLDLSLTIMSRTHATPNYHAGLLVPPAGSSDEDRVDDIVKALGVWARQEFALKLFTTWRDLVLEHSKRVPEATHGVVGMDRARTWLANSFRAILSMRSSWFTHGSLMMQVLKVLPTA